MSEQEWIRVLPARKPRPRRVWHKRKGRNNRRVRPGGPSQASKQMLAFLNFFQAQGKYAMYVRPHPGVIAKRRAAGKAARKSRRANRNG